MIVAVWRLAERGIPDPLASRLNALLAEAGGTRVDGDRTTVVSWPPGQIERRGDTATARAVRSSGGVGSTGLSTVCLENGTLVVSAPVLPQYPLYYLRGPDDSYLLVSSRLEPLARLHPDLPIRELRLVSMVQRWAGVVDSDRGGTVYAGIRRLLPAERIVAGSHGLRFDRTLPRIGRTYRSGRVEDMAAELRDCMDAAVGRAIESSPRVAVLVSGGLDSSGLLALAASRCRRTKGQELRAVSLQFQAPGDDRPYFSKLVEALGVSPVRISPSDAGRWFQQSLCADAQPGYGSSLCLEMLFYAAAAAAPADVTLCGSLGDGLLGGPLPFAQLMRRGRILAAVRGALRIRLPWSMTPWGRIRTYVLRPFLPKAILRARGRRMDRARWTTPRFRRALRKCWSAADRVARPLPDTPDEWLDELCEGSAFALPDIADVGGQVLAATKAAAFDVFMDFDLVRFMLAIDPVLLSYGDEYRGLYRLAMKGVLPEVIRTRQDKAYFLPAVAAAILAADGLDMLRDLSSLDALATRGLVDPGPFRPGFERWLGAVGRGERDDIDPGDERWEQTWQLLSCEAFLRQHGRGRDLV